MAEKTLSYCCSDAKTKELVKKIWDKMEIVVTCSSTDADCFVSNFEQFFKGCAIPNDKSQLPILYLVLVTLEEANIASCNHSLQKYEQLRELFCLSISMRCKQQLHEPWNTSVMVVPFILANDPFCSVELQKLKLAIEMFQLKQKMVQEKMAVPMQVISCPIELPQVLHGNKYLLSFDVEAVGLYGDPIAVGYCLYSVEGEEILNGAIRCESFTNCKGTLADHQWVSKNVTMPSEAYIVITPLELRHMFIDFWFRLKQQIYSHGFTIDMLGECIFPVETRFLDAYFESCTPHQQFMEAPFPLLDVSTIEHASNLQSTFAYLEFESCLKLLFADHNPVHDARRTAIKWLLWNNKLANKSVAPTYWPTYMQTLWSLYFAHL